MPQFSKKSRHAQEIRIIVKTMNKDLYRMQHFLFLNSTSTFVRKTDERQSVHTRSDSVGKKLKECKNKLLIIPRGCVLIIRSGFLLHTSKTFAPRVKSQSRGQNDWSRTLK